MQWYLLPLFWLARCQSSSYKELYERGVDGFDVRIWFRFDGTMVFRHGLFEYSAEDLMSFFNFCDEHCLTVRLMLEARNERDQGYAERFGYETLFASYCERWTAFWPHVKFYGGRNMHTWQVLYDFGWKPVEYEHHASVSPVVLFGKTLPRWTKSINALCPWLWAYRHNQDYDVRAFDDSSALHLMDFL